MNSTNPNPYAPPQAEVRDTFEHEEVPLAGRGERLGAALLDGVIWGLLVMLPLFIGMDFGALAQGDYVSALAGVGAVGASISGIGLLALIAVTIYLVHKNGQTVGKKILGIKVVRSNGTRASLGRIFWLRNVVNAIPGVIPYVGNVYSLVDSLFIFSERRQCVHDKIADTIVVKA